MDSLNQGSPLAVSAPRSRLWKDLKRLAERIRQERGIFLGETEEATAAEGSRRKFWIF
jgi:hypothetical protein